MMRDDLDLYIEERTKENPRFKAALAEEEKELELAIEMQNILAEWRKNAELTSAQVAEKMGIKPPTVSKIERNIVKASIDTLSRYARACGVNDINISL
ncbi:helix-turn-helix domain-containing protein [Xenorhabdus bovienii]|uniref:helix-turn-helix domain-containing protein n=1 Tax=Xenorhabdus bovienii TaxID=40576 RepID=UPI0004D993AE|nr:helix-turn-helix transcriptional regulator [Xenorhabdus bovienii]CDG86770.1 Prophage protein gp48 [Xenorhabdus bovienii str. feltiae France]CDG94386.1 Prophage protein gp48 [Xenorhabdus bovienii str. feltiae Florida]